LYISLAQLIEQRRRKGGGDFPAEAVYVLPCLTKPPADILIQYPFVHLYDISYRYSLVQWRRRGDFPAEAVYILPCLTIDQATRRYSSTCVPCVHLYDISYSLVQWRRRETVRPRLSTSCPA
jgi:hypothetical protein